MGQDSVVHPMRVAALYPREERSMVISLVVGFFPTASLVREYRGPWNRILMVSGAFVYALGGYDGDEIIRRKSSL